MKNYSYVSCLIGLKWCVLIISAYYSYILYKYQTLRQLKRVDRVIEFFIDSTIVSCSVFTNFRPNEIADQCFLYRYIKTSDNKIRSSDFVVVINVFNRSLLIGIFHVVLRRTVIATRPKREHSLALFWPIYRVRIENDLPRQKKKKRTRRRRFDIARTTNVLIKARYCWNA